MTNSAVVPALLRMRAHFLRQALAQVDVQAGKGLVQQQQARVAAPARAPARCAAAGRRTAGAARACAACAQADQVEHLLRPRARAARAAGGACRRPRCRPRSGAETARSPGTPCRCAAPRAPRACPWRRRPAPRRRCARGPRCSGSSPATARSSEVLPQPDGPISTPIWPARQRQRHAFDRGACAAGCRHSAHATRSRLQEHAPYDRTARSK